jgi:hypothetical protein
MQIGEAVVSGASQGPKGGVLAVFLIGAPLMAWNSRPFDPSKVAAWIEDFPGSKTTIKQKLAAVRIRRRLNPAAFLHPRGSNGHLLFHYVLSTANRVGRI